MPLCMHLLLLLLLPLLLLLLLLLLMHIRVSLLVPLTRPCSPFALCKQRHSHRR